VTSSLTRALEQEESEKVVGPSDEHTGDAESV